MVEAREGDYLEVLVPAGLNPFLSEAEREREVAEALEFGAQQAATADRSDDGDQTMTSEERVLAKPLSKLALGLLERQNRFMFGFRWRRRQAADSGHKYHHRDQQKSKDRNMHDGRSHSDEDVHQTIPPDQKRVAARSDAKQQLVRGTVKSDTLPTSDDESEVFNVEQIVGKRTMDDGQTEYLVKWLGFDDSENTWEPIESCGDCQVRARPALRSVCTTVCPDTIGIAPAAQGLIKSFERRQREGSPAGAPRASTGEDGSRCARCD